MDIKPVRTKKEYMNAMLRIDQLITLNPNSGSREFDELDILSTLVEKYEAEHFRIEAPDPIEAIKYILEEKGLDRKYLTELLGSRSKASEIMNRKRDLSKRVIKLLHNNLGIPYDILMA